MEIIKLLGSQEKSRFFTQRSDWTFVDLRFSVIVLAYLQEVINITAPAQQLHKHLIVSNHNQLEIVLLLSGFYYLHEGFGESLDIFPIQIRCRFIEGHHPAVDA